MRQVSALQLEVRLLEEESRGRDLSQRLQQSDMERARMAALLKEATDEVGTLLDDN